MLTIQRRLVVFLSETHPLGVSPFSFHRVRRTIPLSWGSSSCVQCLSLRPDYSALALVRISARFDNEAILVALECIAGRVCSGGAMGEGGRAWERHFLSRSFDEEANRSGYTLRR